MSINEPYVFISYRSTDKEIAYETKNILKKNGIESWMAPESISSNYHVDIPKAIKECSAFVLLLSEDAQQSIWVPKELDMALNNRKTIIPFKIDNSDISDSFNFMLCNAQRIEAYSRLSEAYVDLVKKLKSLIPANDSLASDDENNSFREKLHNHMEFNNQRIDDCYLRIKSLCEEKGVEYNEDGLTRYLVHNGLKMKLMVKSSVDGYSTKTQWQIKECKQDGICFICLGERNEKNYSKIECYKRITKDTALSYNKIVKWYLIEDFITELFGEKALEKL